MVYVYEHWFGTTLDYSLGCGDEGKWGSYDLVPRLYTASNECQKERFGA